MRKTDRVMDLYACRNDVDDPVESLSGVLMTITLMMLKLMVIVFQLSDDGDQT